MIKKQHINIAYLRTGAVSDPCVRFEGDHLRVDYGLDFFWRHVSKAQWDHEVHFTMTLQDGEVLVATECLRGEVHVSDKLAQLISNGKLFKYIRKSVNETARIPMGKSCEVVASNWEPQHQLTDADRSRQCTTTRPRPEEKKKKTELDTKKGWVVSLFKHNIRILRSTVQPERIHRGLYGVGGSHFWPHVRLRPWLRQKTKKDMHYWRIEGSVTKMLLEWGLTEPSRSHESQESTFMSLWAHKYELMTEQNVPITFFFF